MYRNINDDRRDGIYLFKPSCVAEKLIEVLSCEWLMFCLLLTPKMFKETLIKSMHTEQNVLFITVVQYLKHREK